MLLVMAVATGTLALGQHQSWSRSASDQASFTTGGDVQVDPLTPLSPGGTGAVAEAPGVTHSMAVAVDANATPGEIVAVDSAQAPGVVRLRGDETPLPPASLFAAIRPSGAQPGAALPAPGWSEIRCHPAHRHARPGRRAATTATATPRPSASGTSGLAAALGPVVMTLTILDRTGAAFQVEDGSLAPDGRPHVIAVPLDGDKPLYPLRLASITLSFGMPFASVPTLALTVRGASLAHWTQQASTPEPLNFPPDEVARALRREDAHHRRRRRSSSARATRPRSRWASAGAARISTSPPS